jgi:hypothetical protein
MLEKLLLEMELERSEGVWLAYVYLISLWTTCLLVLQCW